MMADRPLIDVGDLPQEFHERGVAPLQEDEPEEILIPLEDAQRRHALRVIQKLGGDKVAAARVLGVSRATLYRMVSKAAQR
jgi:transcriptional regulator of acetoin/glycerol metabolism